MATVSEVAWSPIDRVDFCACCGLRRPLGRTNLDLGPDQEMVRCIDCFFGPGDPYNNPVFLGEAIFVGESDKVWFGQTGDVLLFVQTLRFEPHGDLSTAIIVTEDELFAFTRYQPKKYSELSPTDIQFEE